MFLFLMGTTLFAQENYTDKHKDFSFIMPDNWQCVRYNNTKYNLVLGEKVNDVIQTIVISSEKFKGSMKEYVEYTLENLKMYLPQISFIKNEVFVNNSNIESWKLISENDYENRMLRQYYYILKNNDMFFICVASVAQETSKEIEDVFDMSMSTFKLLDKPLDKLQSNSDTKTENKKED